MQGAAEYGNLDAHLTNTCRLRPRPQPDASSDDEGGLPELPPAGAAGVEEPTRPEGGDAWAAARPPPHLFHPAPCALPGTLRGLTVPHIC